ncbi:MAG: hypothetical protein AB7L09_11140 [Nitrospira sp.]
MRVFTGAAYAAITAIVVGVYKYFNRKPNQFFSGCIWLRVTPEEARKHPLYGMRRWRVSSKDISALQPTVKLTAPIPISDKPSQNTAEAHEDRLYAQIAQELDTNTVDKALWTKAYAQAGGDEKQTRVLYIKARFARLRDIKDI